MGFGAWGGGVFASAPPPFLLGGGGRCDVERPVVSIRNGTGGGLGFVPSVVVSCCNSPLPEGPTKPVASGVAYFVRAYSSQQGNIASHLVGLSSVDVLRRWPEASWIL